MAQAPVKIMMVAGEASADLHGSHLLREIKSKTPQGCRAFGVGGEKLRAEGMEILVAAQDLSIIGISAVVKRLPELLGYFNSLVETAKREKPDLAILMDLPDFNLRLAKKLKGLGIPILYYISPQVWAWRQGRVNHVRKYVDHMLVLFPFEKDFYDRFGVRSTFVGHPLLDFLPKKSEYRSNAEVLAAPRLALLPGSRRSELHHHRDLLFDVVNRLAEKYPGLEVRLPVAATLSMEWVGELYKHPRISVEQGNAYEVLCWADAAGVASGTATLETALIGTPFCLYYLVTPLHAFLFKTVVRWTGPIGMPNLLLDRPVAEEFYQKRAKADLIANEVSRIFEDEGYRRDMVGALIKCRERLGTSGASDRAAREALTMLSSKGANFAAH